MKRLEILKWTATVCLIVGFTLFSAGVEAGFWLQITGGVLWFTASVIMRDRPLMWTNAVMTLGGLAGKLGLFHAIMNVIFIA